MIGILLFVGWVCGFLSALILVAIVGRFPKFGAEGQADKTEKHGE